MNFLVTSLSYSQAEYQDKRPVTSVGSSSHVACFSKVRDSLPAPLCQHMDAGRIRVDIVNITNGSVVVEFNLLIMADLDVGEVSAAFLGALQNNSVLEVDKGRTFIQGTQGQGSTLLCPNSGSRGSMKSA